MRGHVKANTYMPHHKPIPKLRLLRVVVALAIAVAILTLCQPAEAAPRDPDTAAALGAMQAEVRLLNASVNTLVVQGRAQQESIKQFYMQRPVFQADLQAVQKHMEVQLQATVRAAEKKDDRQDNRINLLEVWRWGLGGAFVVLLGILSFVIKSYKAEIKAEEG